MTDLAAENAIFTKDRHVTVSDGTPIAYSVVGDGPKVPVLFINGWTCSDAYWAAIGPGVTDDGHPGVFVDTRAHGQSGLPRDPGFAGRNLRKEDVSVERVARDFLEVLDDAGIDRAVMSGHSMGVQLIFEIYRLAPERVAGIMPVAGAYENPVKTFYNQPVLDRLYPAAEVLFQIVPFELLRPLMRRGAANGPEFGLRVVRAIGVAGPKARSEYIASHIFQVCDANFSVLFRMMSSLRNHRTADLLPKVDAPTLIIAGRKDTFTPPRVQEKMAELIPDSEIVWFEEGGHMLPIEEPEEIVKHMCEFMDRRVKFEGASQAS